MPFFPHRPMPDWLESFDARNNEPPAPLPITDILDGSLYYPACALDGSILKYLVGHIHSFVFADYSIPRESFLSELESRGFKGYSPILSRFLEERELVPEGWSPSIRPHPGDGNPRQWAHSIPDPYAHWSVFERDDTLEGQPLDDTHGPKRFSFLFLCADGVAAYQALYHTHRCVPRIVAMVQPGHGFGLNYTNFFDPNKIFARTVLSNPAGTPETILYGGIYSGYNSPCWPQYPRHLGWVKKCYHRTIGAWGRI